MELASEEFIGWIRAFAFTQLIEVPIYVAALIAFAPALSRTKRWAVAFLCSLLTHPIVWFVFPRIIDSYTDYVPMVIAAETFAVCVEAMVLSLATARHAFVLAFFTNMLSMSLGFVIRYFLGWF